MSVQGKFVKKLANGKIIIQVGNKTFEGKPIDQKAA